MQTVSPSLASITNERTITVVGTNLGSGSDITQVTLAGVPADIVSQDASQVVVRSRLTGAPASGDVVIVSTSRGTSTLTNAFTYVPGTISKLSRVCVCVCVCVCVRAGCVSQCA